jgi:hypothetical protein
MLLNHCLDKKGELIFDIGKYSSFNQFIFDDLFNKIFCNILYLNNIVRQTLTQNIEQITQHTITY